MKDGNKRLATTLVTRAFENVKRIQLERYHKAKTNEEKDSIELDPFVIFHHAVDNCIPVLHLIPCRRGGITYQVIRDKKFIINADKVTKTLILRVKFLRYMIKHFNRLKQKHTMSFYFAQVKYNQ